MKGLSELEKVYLVGDEISDQEVFDAICAIPKHYSAGLVVDLGNSAQMDVSIQGLPVLSGALVAPCSGAVIGDGINMMNSDTYCNLFAAGFMTSGQLRIQVQCADNDVSGQYTDPTSGLPSNAFPGAFQSGGILFLNSGGAGGGVLGAGVSGQFVASGFAVAQGFQRTGTFVRANLLSGDFGCGPLTIGFISNLKTTGSGGGYSPLPGSGSVNV